MIRFLAIAVALSVVGCATQQPASVALLYPGARFQAEGIETAPEAPFSFLHQPHLAVHYRFHDSLRDLQHYFDSLPTTPRWRKVETGDEYANLSRTLCGGDWMRLYRRGAARFVIHACGTEDSPLAGDGNFLTYRFYQVRPEVVLGDRYRQAGRSNQAEDDEGHSR